MDNKPLCGATKKGVCPEGDAVLAGTDPADIACDGCDRLIDAELAEALGIPKPTLVIGDTSKSALLDYRRIMRETAMEDRLRGQKGQMMTNKQKAIKRKHIARINYLIRVKGDPKELAWRKQALNQLLAVSARV